MLWPCECDGKFGKAKPLECTAEECRASEPSEDFSNLMRVRKTSTNLTALPTYKNQVGERIPT